MFYNQDYLLSKQVGLRIVWLASTLGNANASAFRKLSKREIAAVDVSKTCEAVARPNQPLALRTSSHLMYGVVRVYNKQTEYWINDVQASYTSIRKLILQTPHGVLTTLGGVVLVGQDTSTIDLPGGSRRQLDTVSLPLQTQLYRNDLHLDADWFEMDGEEGDEGTARWLPTNDSLSMFGSSAYSIERAREASFDLGLGLTPPHQPFTADHSTIARRDTSNLHRHQDIDTTFDMDHFDLPAPTEVGQDVQLDLGLDTDAANAEGAGLSAFLDDQQGFDLPPLEGDVDLTMADERDKLPPSSSQEADDERPAKRSRSALQDSSIELSDERIVGQREQYVERMARLRGVEALRRLRKDAERAAPLLVFGPAIDLSGTSMLASLWTTGMDLKVAQMMRFKEPQQGQGPSKRARNEGAHADEAAEVVQEPAIMPFDDNDMPYFGEEPGLVGGPGSGDQPRASTPAWEAEIGRAGLTSDTIEMPWNRTNQQLLGDTTLAGDTTVGVSTRSFSIETPTGLRRQGRESSLSRTSGGGRTTLGAIAAEESYAAGSGAEETAVVPESQAIAEQEMMHFYNYALLIRDQLENSHQPLFFSDLAPVADSSPAVAARAFHHILSLGTAHHLSATQIEPYGEIEVRIL